MKFADSISSFWKKYADFNGTASRSEYWWVQLFLAACGLLIYFCIKPDKDAEQIVLLFDIVTFIPCLSLTVRRFNDIKLPTWIPIIALPIVLGLDILSFMNEEYLFIDAIGIFSFFSGALGAFIAGACLAPTANPDSQMSKK